MATVRETIRKEMVRALSFRWASWLLLSVFCFIDISESLQSETPYVEKLWQEMSIREQYVFHSPQVNVRCACCAKKDAVCLVDCSDDPKYKMSDGICIHKNASNRTHCAIKILPAAQEKTYTAYKINHSRQQVYITISYFKDHIRKKLEHIPLEMHQVKISHNTIVKVDASKINVEALNAISWFYGETSSNNIKYGTEVNDVKEKALSKLGWYRKNMATGKYDVDEDAVQSNLMIDDADCPTGDVTWKLNAVNYYNANGLLQSNLPSKTINEATGGIIEDVKINSESKIMSIEYRKNAYNVHFNPARASESFNYSAYISIDMYSNKLIHVTVYEPQSIQVNVEIGIPGTTRSLVTFYHETPNQIHHHRISASIIGPQWVCAYPTNQCQRTTCVMAIYQIQSPPIRVNNIKPTYYNVYNISKPPILKRELSDPITNSDANMIHKVNINVVWISSAGVIVAIMLLVYLIYCRRRRNSCCPAYQNFL